MTKRAASSPRNILERARLPAGEVRVRLVTAPFVENEILTLEHKIPFTALGPAQINGYMASKGYGDCGHHDLNLSILRRMQNDRLGIDLSVFQDATAVGAYLTGDAPGGAVHAETEKLLGICTDGPADLFGLSLVWQHSMDRNIERWLALDLCLIHAMKKRHPDCVTVLGGLFHMDGEQQRALMLALLARCRSLDFVVEGPGEQALYNIAEAVFRGRGFEETGQVYEAIGGQYYLRPGGRPAPDRFVPLRGSVKKKEILLYNRYSAPELQRLPPALPDFRNAEDYRLSGRDLSRLYRFPDALLAENARFLDRTVLPIPLQFTSGCSGSCAHCACAYFPVAALPVREVVRDIARLKERHGSSHFIFMNNAVNWSYDYALAFAEELIASKVDIRWTDSLMLAHLDAALAEKLRLSGFVRADIGVETASRRMRKVIHKPLSSAQVVERLRLLHENGIWCDINMIVGLPHEREEDMEESLALLKDIAPYYVHCAVNQFYLIGISPMGQEPERYGITVRPGVTMTKDNFRIPFDEVGGPAFEERWATGSKASKSVMELKNPSFFYFPWHLMFFLYDIHGHENKAAIEKVYGELLKIHTDLRSASQKPDAAGPEAGEGSPAAARPASAAQAPADGAGSLVKHHALLLAALKGAQPPAWAGFRLRDASMRDGDPTVWLRLERGAGEALLLRLFRIRGPEDRFAARRGDLGLSFETQGVASAESASGLLDGLLEFLGALPGGACP